MHRKTKQTKGKLDSELEKIKCCIYEREKWVVGDIQISMESLQLANNYFSMAVWKKKTLKVCFHKTKWGKRISFKVISFTILFSKHPYFKVVCIYLLIYSLERAHEAGSVIISNFS